MSSWLSFSQLYLSDLEEVKCFHIVDGGWLLRRQTQKVYNHMIDLNQYMRLQVEIFLIVSV